MANFDYGAADTYALFNSQKRKSTAHGIEVLHAQADRRNGQFQALEGANWMAGTALMATSVPFTVNRSDGSRVLGFASQDRVSTTLAVVVDAQVTLNGTAATSVGKANISNVQVREDPNFGGTLYTGGGTDYTVVAAAGTIARNGGGAITDGQVVYVTFTYEMPASELKYLGGDLYTGGQNYSLNHFERVEMLQGEIEMLTATWDTSAGAVSYGAVGTDLYVSSTGLLTTDTGATHKVGTILQPPTADNGFMLVSVTADANTA